MTVRRLLLPLLATTIFVIPANAQHAAQWNFDDAAGIAIADQTLRDALFSPDGGIHIGSAYMTSNFLIRDGNPNTAVGITTLGGSGGQALAMQGSNQNAPNDTTNTPNNGRYLEFGVDLTGFSFISVWYQTRGSTFGFDNNQFQYSIDGGENYIDFGVAYSGAEPTYFTKVYSFPNNLGLVNNPDVRFRIIFDGAGRPLGNNRIDNIDIQGAFSGGANAPEPASLTLLLITGGTLGVIRASAKRQRDRR